MVPQSNRFWTSIFLLVSLLACVSGALLLPSVLGLFTGYQELSAQNHEAAIAHFNRGLGYLAENYPELARLEFEIALRFDGGFEPAKQKLRELQPIANDAPGAPQENRVAATLFEEARNLVAQKQWSDAITRLEQLRTLSPIYRTPEVSDLLFQAYVGGGRAGVAATQIELARGRFEAALALRNDPEVRRQRDLAVLYLDGQQAVGYNWQVAIQKFSALYQQDPSYDDVKKRLFDAHTQYGDLAAKQGAPCLAAREYDGALALTLDAAVTQKRNQVMALCRQAISASPTPLVAAGTDSFVWKIATTNDRPCNGTGEIVGFVRDALGRLLTGVAVGYYADGTSLVTTRTNANGQYQFVLGKDPGLLHVTILAVDGKTPSSLRADVQYPGGNTPGCHIMVDWQRVQ
jgi:tetratricopeptide (TPR) repeat protein